MPIVPSPAPLPRELAIETSALVKTYGRIVRALDGLTFSVRAGTVFGLLGPNGAGKSTTVKVLNTLTRPDSGVARVEGIDVVRSPDAVRRVIGCVAQKSGVDVNATGRENLVLLPLTFLSPVFMAPTLMPAWVQRVARLNPVSWSVTAARSALSAHPNWALIATSIGELVLLSAFSAWVASRAFRAYQRSI